MVTRPWRICCGETCQNYVEEQSDNEFRLFDTGNSPERYGTLTTTNSGDQSFVTLENDASLRLSITKEKHRNSDTESPLVLYLHNINSMVSPKILFPHDYLLTDLSTISPTARGKNTLDDRTASYLPDTSVEDTIDIGRCHDYSIWSMLNNPVRRNHYQDQSFQPIHRIARGSVVRKGLGQRTNLRTKRSESFRYIRNNVIERRGRFVLKSHHVLLPFHEYRHFTTKLFSASSRHNAVQKQRRVVKSSFYNQRGKQKQLKNNSLKAAKCGDPRSNSVDSIHSDAHPTDNNDLKQLISMVEQIPEALQKPREGSFYCISDQDEKHLKNEQQQKWFSNRAEIIEGKSHMLSHVASMPADGLFFDETPLSVSPGDELCRTGLSDPNGREEKRKYERKYIMEENSDAERKRSDPGTAVSQDEEDALFLKPTSDVIGRFNGWDCSTTQYLKKEWRTSKSEKGSRWTRCVETFSSRRLLQRLIRTSANSDLNISSVESSNEYMSQNTLESWDGSEREGSFCYKDDSTKGSFNDLPSDWMFVPRRVHSSASLWILVGSSIRRRFLSDTPSNDDENHAKD